MKKVFVLFAVAGLFLTASCGNEKVDQEATEIEILEEDPAETMYDSAEILENDSVDVDPDTLGKNEGI